MAVLAQPSVLLQAGINLIPLGLVLTSRWDSFDVLLAYWWEGIVIAALALIKTAVARARQPDRMEATLGLFDLPLGAYLIVCILSSSAYLLLISGLAVTFDGSLNSLGNIFSGGLAPSLEWIRDRLFGGGIIFFAVAIMIPHAISFVTDYLGRSEFGQLQEIFQPAVIRILSIELASLTFVLISLAVGWFPLWLVVVFKILLDAVLHALERMGANPDTNKSKQSVIGP